MGKQFSAKLIRSINIFIGIETDRLITLEFNWQIPGWWQNYLCIFVLQTTYWRHYGNVNKLFTKHNKNKINVSLDLPQALKKSEP